MNDREVEIEAICEVHQGSGHLVWYPTINAVGLKTKVRIHDLRHAHVSWLLAGGADLQVVKERLGHASISTTERYLHTLPEAGETALTALSAIRNRTATK